jgi:hypothetical protein
MNFGIHHSKAKRRPEKSAAVFVDANGASPKRLEDPFLEYAETLSKQRHAVKDYFPITLKAGG